MSQGPPWQKLRRLPVIGKAADWGMGPRAVSKRTKNAAARIEGDKIYRRTLGFASLGGATLDNEENYLIKKLFTALGAIQIENQARI